VDLVVTSPPYDELRTYKGHEWNFEIFKEIAEGLSRVLKQGGVIVWVVNDQTINGSETLTSAKQKIYFRENCGLNIHDTMFYQRQPRFPDDKRYQNAIEYMFVLSKGIPKTINLIADKPNLTAGTTRVGASERNINGSMRESWLSKTKGTIKEFGVRNNIWEYQTGYNQSSKDKEAFEHPAIFPEALAQDHILSWSNEGDIVYDPFSGSGTTCKVADRLGRAWFGSEIAEEYQAVALRRIENDLFTKAST
jgi:site-specific DNA-methyltransferase (adenine-specific)